MATKRCFLRVRVYSAKVMAFRNFGTGILSRTGAWKTWKSSGEKSGALEGRDDFIDPWKVDANPLGALSGEKLVQAKTVIAGRTPSRD